MEWLAAGKLPWSCMAWKGLDAEGLTKAGQRSSGNGICRVSYCRPIGRISPR